MRKTRFILSLLVVLNVLQASIIASTHFGYVVFAPPSCRARVFGVEVELPGKYILRADHSHIAHLKSESLDTAGGLTTGLLSSFPGLSEDLWVLDDEFERNGLEIKMYYRASGGGPVPLIFISDGEEYVTVLDPDVSIWQSIVAAVEKNRG